MPDAPVMEKTELRHFLNEAKKKPVHVALGVAADGMAVVLLHKVTTPLMLSKELAQKSPGVKTLRWGEVFVDEQKDPKILVARLNKAASGLARKVAKIVKPGGFTKVVLEFEDGSKEEGADDAAAEEGAEAGAAAAPGQAAPAGAASPNGAAPAAKPVDLNALAAELTTLVKRMFALIEADPSRRESLTGLAKAARAALDSKVAEKAKAALDSFKSEIARMEAPKAAKPAAPVDPEAVAKARKFWLGTRKRVDADLGKLLATIRTIYDGHSALADIEKNVQSKLDSVLDALDEDLADKLDELGKAAAPERAQLVKEAKQIIARYQKHVQSDKLVGALDGNPFVPLTVQKTVNDALAVLSRSVG